MILGIVIGLWLGIWLCLVISGGNGIRTWLLPFAALGVLLFVPVLVLQSLFRRKAG